MALATLAHLPGGKDANLDAAKRKPPPRDLADPAIIR
jgi:hypothetical protein